MHELHEIISDYIAPARTHVALQPVEPQSNQRGHLVGCMAHTHLLDMQVAKALRYALSGIFEGSVLGRQTPQRYAV